MDFARKMALFDEALHSAEMNEVRRWSKASQPRFVTPEFAKHLSDKMRGAMVEYFAFAGQRELGSELAKSLVLCRRRRSHGHFSVCMREALLSTGEDETGEWEAMS